MKGTEKMKFTEFNFKPYIQEALKEINFREATEVQEKLIPIVLAGNDLVGESKTGSGKTHTFLLPIFQTLNETANKLKRSSRLLVGSWRRKFTKLLVKSLVILKKRFGL